MNNTRTNKQTQAWGVRDGWRNEPAAALSFNSSSITHFCLTIYVPLFFVCCHFISLFFSTKSHFSFMMAVYFTIVYALFYTNARWHFCFVLSPVAAHFQQFSVYIGSCVSAPMPEPVQTHQLSHVCCLQSFSSADHMSHHISHDIDEMSNTTRINAEYLHIICFTEGNHQTTNIFDSTSVVWEFALNFIFLSQICLENEISFDPMTRSALPYPFWHYYFSQLVVGAPVAISKNIDSIHFSHPLCRCLSFSVRSHLVFSFPIRKHSSF